MSAAARGTSPESTAPQGAAGIRSQAILAHTTLRVERRSGDQRLVCALPSSDDFPVHCANRLVREKQPVVGWKPLVLRDVDLALTHGGVRRDLPSGTVTFLFTDVEGS